MFWMNCAICRARLSWAVIFGVVLLELNEVLLELVVAEQRVLVIGRVVDDSAPELRGGGADAQSQHEHKH